MSYLCLLSVGKTCTSSRFECAFNLTKGPRLFFSEFSDAKPYNKICRYGGRLYQLGWNIAIDGDPCLNCICDERWDDRNPLESLSCKRTDCEPDLQIKLKSGCLPRYASTECCPVDYYCRMYSKSIKCHFISFFSTKFSQGSLCLEYPECSCQILNHLKTVRDDLVSKK